jgi:hypothetical protein
MEFKAYVSGLTSMESTRVRKAEKQSLVLFIVCLVVFCVVWLHTSYQPYDDPESRMWAPIAGFFKGLIFGGLAAIVPSIFSACVLLKTNPRSKVLNIILGVSGAWVCLVAMWYVF